MNFSVDVCDVCQCEHVPGEHICRPVDECKHPCLSGRDRWTMTGHNRDISGYKMECAGCGNYLNSDEWRAHAKERSG